MNFYNPKSKLTENLVSVAIVSAIFSIGGTIFIFWNNIQYLGNVRQSLLLQDLLVGFSALSSTFQSILFSAFILYLGSVLYISSVDTTQLNFQNRNKKSKILISAVGWVHFILPAIFVIYTYWLVGHTRGFVVAVIVGLLAYYLISKSTEYFENFPAFIQILLLTVAAMLLNVFSPPTIVIEIIIISATLFYLKWLSSVSKEYYSANTDIETIIGRIEYYRSLEEKIEEDNGWAAANVVFSDIKETLDAILDQPNLYIGSNLIAVSLISIYLFNLNASVIPIMYLIAALPLSLVLMGRLRFNPYNFYRFNVENIEDEIVGVTIEKNEIDGYFKILTRSNEKVVLPSDSIVSYEPIEEFENILEVMDYQDEK